MKKKYTEKHLAFLRRAYKKKKVEDVTEAFNRKFGMNCTVDAIRAVLLRNKIKCGRPASERLVNHRRLFTQDQVTYIQKIAPGRWRTEITSMVNLRFGTDFTVVQIKALMARQKIKHGLNSQFRKGGKPWNAGTKGQGLTGPNRGSFKPGSVPPNRNPLWHERINKDGIIEIKVPERDPYTGFPTRYISKHVWVWEQENGPVPENHVVAFRDSDRSNVCPENLMLVSRTELLDMNNMKYREAHPAIKPSIRALVKLKSKMKEVDNAQ